MLRYKYILFENDIPKAPAYWIDPIGHILPIFDDDKHIGMILKKPSAFGLDIKEIKMIYDAEGEILGDEGKAREKIIKELIQRGWIRIRHYVRQDMFTVNVYKLQKKTKDNLYRWAKAMSDIGRKFSQVKIDLPTGVINYSVGDIANDVLFAESKNAKALKVVKNVMDLPDIKIESMFKEKDIFEHGKRYSVKWKDGNDTWTFEGVYNKKENSLIGKKNMKLTISDDIFDIKEILPKEKNINKFSYETPIAKWVRSVDAYNKKEKGK